jgi:hypothetical protein
MALKSSDPTRRSPVAAFGGVMAMPGTTAAELRRAAALLGDFSGLLLAVMALGIEGER